MMELEFAYLNHILTRTHSAVDYVMNMPKRIFQNPILSDIFDLIYEFTIDYETIPCRVVLEKLIEEKLQEDPAMTVKIILYEETVEKIYDTPVDESIDGMIKTLILKNKNERLMLTIPGMIQTKDYHSAIRELEKVEELKNSDDDDGYYYFEEMENRMDYYASEYGAECVIPTGYPSLDRLMTYGGMLPGEFGIWIGRTNIGKTTVMCNLAANLIRAGRGVAYYSLESEERQIVVLMDSILSGELRAKVPTNFNDIKGNIERFKQDKLLVIKKWPGRRKTVWDFQRHIKRLQKKMTNLSAVIIDYADEIKPSDKYDRHELSVRAVFLDLNDMASELGIIVHTPTQSNLKGLRDLVDEGGAGDAYSKLRGASLIVSLNQTTEEELTGKMRWFVIKVREGVKKKIIPVIMDGSTGRITEDRSVSTVLSNIQRRGTSLVG